MYTTARPHKAQSNSFRTRRVGKGLACSVLAILLAMTAATAQIATGTTGIDATGNASSEMAACNNGSTQQSRDTCMAEARNASAAKRSGQLDTNGNQYQANELTRCEPLKGEDKIACQARVTGLGNAQGSVAGGGVIREVETVVVPADATSVRIQPQTNSDTIVVIPAPQ